MGKRSRQSTYSPHEAKQFAQSEYDQMIKDAQHEKSSRTPVQLPVSMEILEGSRIRPCWSCDCRDACGYCQNYFLYAVLQDRCVIKRSREG